MQLKKLVKIALFIEFWVGCFSTHKTESPHHIIKNRSGLFLHHRSSLYTPTVQIYANLYKYRAPTKVAKYILLIVKGRSSDHNYPHYNSVSL